MSFESINFITHYRGDSIFDSKQYGHHSQGYSLFKQIAKKNGLNVVENHPIVDNSIVIFRDLPKPDKVNNKPLNCLFILHIWESPLQRQFLFNEKNWEVFDMVLSSNDSITNSRHRVLRYFADNYHNSGLNLDFKERKFAIAICSNRYSGFLASRRGKGMKEIPFLQEIDFNWSNNIKDIFLGGLKEMYSFRRKMLLKKYDLFDLYGKFWKSKDFHSWISKFHYFIPEKFESKGELLGDKRNLMSKYKYAMSFENYENDSGYISEKIFECIQSGCVPLYSGCKNISDYVPQECFIYVDSGTSPKDLKFKLNSITKDEWSNYIFSGQDFLESTRFKSFFSPEAFSNTLMKHVLESISLFTITQPDNGE